MEISPPAVVIIRLTGADFLSLEMDHSLNDLLTMTICFTLLHKIARNLVHPLFAPSGEIRERFSCFSPLAFLLLITYNVTVVSYFVLIVIDASILRVFMEGTISL
jgi:hypothetical protein